LRPARPGINGARTVASSAGCAQANISRSRSSGIADAGSPAASAIIRNGSIAASRTCRRRTESIALRRATANSHASGARGTPCAGQVASALAKASDSASSAPARSRVRAARKASSLP